MKRLLFILSLLICHLTFSPTGTRAQGWPAHYGGVMLQAFYWDSFDDSQWSELSAQADRLQGTFDLVWLPQSGYCGGTSMGYDDLYWFSNYNSSFGNEQQLRQLISTFSDKGIKTVADVVINHRKNLSNWVDFPAETYRGVTYQMTSTDIVANDDDGATRNWATQNGYSLSENNDTGEGWGGMRDLDHKSQNVQTCVKAYLQFLRNDLGYAGFRYDMVKGYSPAFTALYNSAAQPEFSVGECWDGTTTIRNWIDGTALDGTPTSAAFDFQFRYTVRNAMNNTNYSRLAQQNDGNWPLVSSSYEAGRYRRWAVTFVENHDTERRSNATQDPLVKDTLAANAYMLAMPGTPCVFFKHWQAYPAQIKAMVAARKLAGINNESNYRNVVSTSTCYVNTVDDKLTVAVGNVAEADKALNSRQWIKAVEGYHYAYYLPASLNTAYADLPSGTYEGTQQVRLSAITTTTGNIIVYTTDGSTPTISSPKAAQGGTVTIPVGTTTLTVGLLNGTTVSAVTTRQYVVKEREGDKPADIPAFCTVADGEVCAFFEAPATWTSTIHCWAWTNTPSDNFTYSENHNWPGVSCTLIGTHASGNKVWKWTWDGTRQNNTSAKQPAFIIFNNNGAPQTDDMPFQNGGYYTKDGLRGTVTPTAINTVATDASQQSNDCYDLQGRRLSGQPVRKGLYIRGGRIYSY